MALDAHGDLAAVSIAFFVIIFSLIVTNYFFYIKAGRAHESAWIFLILFCIAKISGSICLIIEKKQKKPSRDLIIATAILNGIALSPLLQTALAFANTIVRQMPNTPKLVQQMLRLEHLVFTAAVVMGSIGPSKLSSSDPDTVDTGLTLVKVSGILYFVGFLVLAGCILAMISLKAEFSPEGKTLHPYLIATLPFLFIRALYSLLNATNYSFSGNAKYSITTGEIGYAVGMGFLMEVGACVCFIVAGVLVHRFGAGLRKRVPTGLAGEGLEPYGARGGTTV